MSAVLRHVAKYRPHWIVDYQAQEGQWQVGRGIVVNAFDYDSGRYPSPHYDAEVQICLYDTWANWYDRPNTRVSSALHERFGLGWDAECGRYQVYVRDEITATIQLFLKSIVGERNLDNIVAIHYKGDSSPTKKNLTDEDAWYICDALIKMGCTPLLMDWRNLCRVANEPGVFTVGRSVMSKEWGRDAEVNCAIISQCKAFVGIDSGPSKCAAATETPSLVVWTGHHPAPFHDPAPNTTHLVPVNYHNLEPVCNDAGVVKWFEANHSVRQYIDGVGMINEIQGWLGDTLKWA